MSEESEEAAAMIAEARTLCAAATPGPWTGGYSSQSGYAFEVYADDTYVCGAPVEADAAMIARARTLLPALADALEVFERTDPAGLIAEARALCAAATPGPWGRGEQKSCVAQEHTRRIVCWGPDPGGASWGNDDAALIARARTLLPALADALEGFERRATT